METHTLQAQSRSVVGRKVKHLRVEGKIPGNVYGKGVKSTAVEVPQKEFMNLYQVVGETGLVDLHIGSDKRPVLIHNVQFHPLNSAPLHIDFYQVNLKQKVAANVPIEIVGEAQAVKDKAGVLLQLIGELHVEALPADLPDRISVEVTPLKAIDEVIKVKDLKVSDKVKILTNFDTDVVKIAPLISKEAEKMAEEAQAAAAAAAATAAQTTAPTAESTQPATTSTPAKEQTK